MKTSHLILFILLIYIVLTFYKKREYFSHSSNYHYPKKLKLTHAILQDIALPKPLINNSGERYIDLYNSGKCSIHYLSPVYTNKRTQQPVDTKYCQCKQDGNIIGGLIPARNMPNFACNKNDFTRGKTK